MGSLVATAKHWIRFASNQAQNVEWRPVGLVLAVFFFSSRSIYTVKRHMVIRNHLPVVKFGKHYRNRSSKVLVGALITAKVSLVSVEPA